MLIRDIFIQTTKRSKVDTEFPDTDIYESDIRPSLEGHGLPTPGHKLKPLVIVYFQKQNISKVIFFGQCSDQ